MNEDAEPHIALETFWPYQVTVLADQASRYILRVVKTVADLNQSQWRVLAAVADKPGCTSADVTAITPMDKTIVSRAVASLLQAGYISRRTDSGDKRRLSLEPTAMGRDCYQTVARKLNATLVTPFEQSLSPLALVETIKTFRAAMDKQLTADE